MLCLVSALDAWGLSMGIVGVFKVKSNSELDSVDLALALTILNCGLSFLPVFNASRNDLAEA